MVKWTHCLPWGLFCQNLGVNAVKLWSCDCRILWMQARCQKRVDSLRNLSYKYLWEGSVISLSSCKATDCKSRPVPISTKEALSGVPILLSAKIHVYRILVSSLVSAWIHPMKEHILPPIAGWFLPGQTFLSRVSPWDGSHILGLLYEPRGLAPFHPQSRKPKRCEPRLWA